jgi:U3 small nucleolar RNA-associated protein 14
LDEIDDDDEDDEDEDGDEESDDEDEDEDGELDKEDQDDESEIKGINEDSYLGFIGLDGSDSDEDEIDEEFKSLVEDEEDNDVQEIDDETKADNLAAFIGSLDKKRKRTNDDNEISSLEKPKKQLKEHTEAYKESEYNLTIRESSNIKKKIDLQDLIGSIQEETGFSGLKQKLASLESGGNRGTYKEPLPAPLPPRIQGKFNRQAAYEETKKDITKWEPIVKQNREAEVLKFPMNATPLHKPTNNVLAATFQVCLIIFDCQYLWPFINL